jgi:unsaturated rhamnogalacturonyl hydrolase
MMSRRKIARWRPIAIPTKQHAKVAIAWLVLSATVVSQPHPRKVILDAWFNSQQRKNAAGQMEYFHYKWEDTTDSGFSLFADIWHSFGVQTDTLYRAPTAENLKGSQFYVIVSPDIPVKNPNPHYMQDQDAAEVAAWVKQGGVLVLMENDPANADIEHLNLLADRFGIHFNPVLSHHVVGDDIVHGRIPADGPPFQGRHILYVKDTCTLSLKSPATPLLQDSSGVVMATAKFGNGTVFAVVDPWLYNEYTNGKHLSPEYDNLAAGKELVRWLLQQVPEKN